MNEIVDKLVRTLLYEGYALYPYRPSVKNRQRWTFGGLYPPAWSDAQDGADACMMRTECLVSGTVDAVVGITVRFIHLTDRIVGELPHPLNELPRDGDPEFRAVEILDVDGKQYQPWQEATERSVDLGEFAIRELLASPRTISFAFASHRDVEPLRATDDRITGILLRRQQTIEGDAELFAARVADDLYKITSTIRNRTAIARREMMTRDTALMGAFLSTHTILHVHGGEFVSLTDPPEPWRAAAAACGNVGCWPVLVGVAPARDTVLASPIILADYPQLAPESPGDLFDATEIDEILTLRVMTLTDEEKRAAAAIDPRVGELLARTDDLPPEQMTKLHGVLRGLRPVVQPTEKREARPSVVAHGVSIHVGDRVRLRPGRRADVFDIALNGMTATIVAIEKDFENRTHFAVTIDDDPGKDLGLQGQPGHRFFFGVDEIEPLTDDVSVERVLPLSPVSRGEAG